MQKFKRILSVINAALGTIIINAIFIAVALAAIGALFMWLWNNNMPDIFGLPTINIWQAVGLICLLNTALIGVTLSKQVGKE